MARIGCVFNDLKCSIFLRSYNNRNDINQHGYHGRVATCIKPFKYTYRATQVAKTLYVKLIGSPDGDTREAVPRRGMKREGGGCSLCVTFNARRSLHVFLPRNTHVCIGANVSMKKSRGTATYIFALLSPSSKRRDRRNFLFESRYRDSCRCIMQRGA